MNFSDTVKLQFGNVRGTHWYRHLWTPMGKETEKEKDGRIRLLNAMSGLYSYLTAIIKS